MFFPEGHLQQITVKRNYKCTLLLNLKATKVNLHRVLHTKMHCSTVKVYLICQMNLLPYKTFAGTLLTSMMHGKSSSNMWS